MIKPKYQLNSLLNTSKKKGGLTAALLAIIILIAMVSMVSMVSISATGNQTNQLPNKNKVKLPQSSQQHAKNNWDNWSTSNSVSDSIATPTNKVQSAAQVPKLRRVASPKEPHDITSLVVENKSKHSLAPLLEKAKGSNQDEIKHLSQQMRKQEEEDKLQALKLVQRLGTPLNEREKSSLSGFLERKLKDGRTELTPLIKIAHDINASISSEALNLDLSEAITNYSFKVGVWDSGAARVTHQELTGRSYQKDGAALNDHSTRVAGVIASKGITNTAKAISSLVGINSYDWNNDLSEMALTVANQEDINSDQAGTQNKIPLSNHSYNFSSGWYQSSGVYVFVGHYTMGQYNAGVEEIDALISAFPYLTMVRSAGNDRTENPKAGDRVRLNFWSQDTTVYDPTVHPLGDGVQKGGFDTISYAALAKNVITVGAINDAVTASQRDLTKATLTTYTSWGPTDDGRIKPDLVANGNSLVVPSSSSDTSYSSLSGTSAAAPVVTSIAALLTQYWVNSAPSLESNNRVPVLRASTLKAVLIHGADDLGNPGPDYKFGWGLANAKKSLEILKTQRLSPNSQTLKEGAILNPGSVNAQTVDFYWNGTSQIKTTICWTDPKATPTSEEDSVSPKLVNDIDIKIVDPEGIEHLPFVMPFTTLRTLESMNANATQGVNSTDNVEMITINSPKAGKYTLKISVKNLPSNPQDYSLVMSGTQPSDPNPQEPYAVWAAAVFGENWSSTQGTSPLEDFDNDGVNNWSEFNLQTNPTNDLSKMDLKIIDIKVVGLTKTLTLRVSPVPKTGAGSMQVVSTSDLSLGSWEGPSLEVPQLNPEEGQNMTFVDVVLTSSSDNLFFKLVYTPPSLN